MHGRREEAPVIRDKKSTTPGPLLSKEGNNQSDKARSADCLPPTAYCQLSTAFSRYARYSFIMLI
jgi:hypothetical protein